MGATLEPVSSLVEILSRTCIQPPFLRASSFFVKSVFGRRGRRLRIMFSVFVFKKKEHNTILKRGNNKQTTSQAKNLGKNRSAKALHFTRDKGTIEAAEAANTSESSHVRVEWIPIFQFSPHITLRLPLLTSFLLVGRV